MARVFPGFHPVGSTGVPVVTTHTRITAMTQLVHKNPQITKVSAYEIWLGKMCHTTELTLP